MNASMVRRLLRTAAFLVRRPKSTQTVIAVAVMLSVLTPLSLHAAGPSGKKHHKRASHSQTKTLTKSCSLKNCTATASLFPTLSMPCPGPIGTKCTYQVHVNAQTHVSAFDNGLFRFKVDSQFINSGGTDANGYVSWTNADPDSGAIAWDARSYTVIVDVSNDAAQDQKHTIQILFGCSDSNSSGSCDASTGFSTMTTDVYTEEIIIG
jgi:hypothetical protein